jgi:hypothetical protein
LAADQVTTQDKEKIDTDPAEAIHSAGQFESKQCGVVNDDHDDGKRAKKIQAGLAFAISKARIDFYLTGVRLRPAAHQSYFRKPAENLSVICGMAKKSFEGYRWGAHAARVLVGKPGRSFTRVTAAARRNMI